MFIVSIGDALANVVNYSDNEVVSSIEVTSNSVELKKYEQNFSILLSVHTGKPRKSAIIEVMKDGTVSFYEEFVGKLAFNYDYSDKEGYFYALEKPSTNSCNSKNHDIRIIGFDKTLRKSINTVSLDHTNKHDFDILPNGNYVFNSYEPSRSSFGTEFNYKGGCIIESVVQEIDPDKKVVFEWHSSHSMPVEPNFYVDKPKRGEYAHLNSTDLNYSKDEYLFSLRGKSQVVIVNRKNGETTHKIGGVNPDVSILNDEYDGFCGQHQVEWTSEDTFLLYDNGDNAFCVSGSKEREFSRAVEYKIDRTQKTADLIWQYKSPYWHGTFAGGVTRMTNGLNVISWGNHVRNKLEAPTVTVVTPEGKVIWEMTVRFKGDDGMEVTPVSYRANVREMGN